MRLLNVYNLSFATFENDEIPPYAIASHRWFGDDETTYSDVLNRQNTISVGYKKVKGFCDFVKWRNKEVREHHLGSGATHRLEWIWIDTCCIDRTSSAGSWFVQRQTLILVPNLGSWSCRKQNSVSFLFITEGKSGFNGSGALPANRGFFRPHFFTHRSTPLSRMIVTHSFS